MLTLSEWVKVHKTELACIDEPPKDKKALQKRKQRLSAKAAAKAFAKREAEMQREAIICIEHARFLTICLQVAKEYRTRLGWMIRHSKRAHIWEARRVALYLGYTDTSYPKRRILRELRRTSESAGSHAARRVHEQLKINSALAERVARIRSHY